MHVTPIHGDPNGAVGYVVDIGADADLGRVLVVVA